MRWLKCLSFIFLLFIVGLSFIQVNYAAGSSLPIGVSVNQNSAGFQYEKVGDDYYFVTNGTNTYIVPSQLTALTTSSPKTISVESSNVFYSTIVFVIDGVTYQYSIQNFHSFVLTEKVQGPNTYYEISLRLKQATTGNPITILTTEIEHSVFGTQEVQIYLKYSTSESSIPLMEGGTYIANVDDPKTITQIRTEINLRAIDAHDGDITHLIQIVENNYTGNESTLGIYDVVFYVEDSGGNGVYATIVIIVMDVTAPTVPPTQSIAIRYNQTFNPEDYISTLSISDNYDDYEDLLITIQHNTYTGNESVVGTYQVVYRVEDLSENHSIIIVNITVYDDIAPVISGPSTLSRSQTQSLTINQIVAQYTASDGHDGDLTSSIYVHFNGYSNHSAPGIYTVILRVADASGNIGSKTISVSITDEIPPVFYVENNGKIIHVSALMTLSENNIVQILLARGFINLTPESIAIFEINNYEMNATTSGSYPMMLRIYDDDSYSTSMSYSFMMIVYGGDEELDPPPYTEELSWYENEAYIIIGSIIAVFLLFMFIRKKR